MSYQVLARKWRPGNFRDLAGQEHVLQALINALDHDRLHHAYLFTGTRGVGKTTIARILAKCLNCETGVSSNPCGTCASCLEIDEGRFVDLIEVDAASRTKVEDTRELLDNVQYAPSRGRYKVYLIDEVHMLSMNSFNALLKTLEEPPPHVKFLLATTDPQKLPVTILSRCLQFNLKNLNPERIVDYLKVILEKEMIEFEDGALWEIGRAADGSMRDALSLTDQAIGFGNGKLDEADVRNMLGSIDRQLVHHILTALSQQDYRQVLDSVAKLAEFNPDYTNALKDLLSLLHRVALAQAIPDAIDNGLGDADFIKDIASKLSSQDVQLFYQLGINSQRDLPLAPDPRSGFEMALLRMLAFRPAEDAQTTATPSSGSVPPVANIKPATADQMDNTEQASEAVSKSEPAPANEKKNPSEANNETAIAQKKQATQVTHTPSCDNKQPTAPISTIEPVKKPTSFETEIKLEHLATENWHQTFNALAIEGIIQNIAAHCVLDAIKHGDTTELHFTLDDNQASLYNRSHDQRLEKVLKEHFQQDITLSISVGTVAHETPAAMKQRLLEERQQQAQISFAQENTVQALVEHFDGQILENTVNPVDH